jgi:DNA-binding LacI/PurR family transcriptional regulator
MATMFEVAKLAGVSTATVSRSFANSSGLSRETRERVLKVANGLNYRPRPKRPAGRGRSSDIFSPPGTKTIGFEYFSYRPTDMLPTNPFYNAVLAGAQAEAAALGLHLLLSTTHRHIPSLVLPPMVQEQVVGGMLLVGTADPEVLETFVRYIPHIVLLDNRDIRGRHDSIYTDGFGGTFEATKHLLELGHRNIGFITNRLSELTFNDRYKGYTCALVHAGIEIEQKNIWAVGSPAEIFDPSLTVEDIEMRFVRELVEYLKLPRRPSAFVAANDNHAINLIRACNELNVAIPRELSIVGFDDQMGVSAIDPPLTTVRVDTLELGRLGVRRLDDRITAARLGRKVSGRVTEIMPVNLIVRSSTARFTG